MCHPNRHPCFVAFIISPTSGIWCRTSLLCIFTCSPDTSLIGCLPCIICCNRASCICGLYVYVYVYVYFGEMFSMYMLSRQNSSFLLHKQAEHWCSWCKEVQCIRQIFSTYDHEKCKSSITSSETVKSGNSKDLKISFPQIVAYGVYVPIRKCFPVPKAKHSAVKLSV